MGGWQTHREAQGVPFLRRSDSRIGQLFNCWAKTMQWPAAQGEECVKFMQSKTGHADLLVFCDGRSRSSRQALERLNENTRHLIDFWATYTASTRLGRRQATKGHQVWGRGGGNHHIRCDILWCRTDVVGEYNFGHRRRRAENPGCHRRETTSPDL